MVNSKPTVVVLSHWPWDVHFWQFNKQVGLQLAELGHRVVWVDDRLRVRRDGWRHWLAGFPFGRVTTVGKMQRLQPWSFSRLRLGERNPLPAAWTALQIRRVLRRLRLTGAAVLVYTPAENAIVRRLQAETVAYWIGDDMTLPDEDWIVNRADVILALSAPTFDEMAARAPGRTFRVPTGVPSATFAETADQSECPPEMLGLAHPILGFAGNITADRIDFAIVRAVAEATPEGTVVLIGPCPDRRSLGPLPSNVVFIGEQRYEDVPRFLAHFDVAIVPYLRTPFNERSSPLKIHESFAVGLPVVGTRLSSLVEYGDLAVAIDTASEFVAAIGPASRSRHDPMLIERRRHAAAENGVDRIAKTVSDLLSGQK